MKKIELKALKLSAKDLLSREHMRAIIAGSCGDLCNHDPSAIGSLRVLCNNVPYYHLALSGGDYCCVPCPDPTSDCLDTV
jgi:hypothetical protein